MQAIFQPACAATEPALQHVAHTLSGSRPGPLVDSNALLQGGKTVDISHNGSIYRLQATKLGKLILTK